MSYVMDSPNEAQRLEEQSKNDFFAPEGELAKIKLKSQGIVLDAGCGSGIFSKAIKHTNPQLEVQGCDIDCKHIGFAKNANTQDVTFFQHDLLQNQLPQKYDHIFNRYVAHHFNRENYSKILENFHQSLNPEGELTIIDIDGLYSNIGTLSTDLDKLLSKIHAKFHGDLKITRKLPELLHNVGFKEISWQIEVIDFSGHNRESEVLQWESRIDNGFKFYIDILGSEFEATRFKKLYLDQISKKTVPLFYNKFIITAKK